MSRYFPSMKRYSWVILVCLVITLIAGFFLAKAQPVAYQVNSTLLVSAGAPGTTFPGATASSGDSLSQSIDAVSEIPTRSVMDFVYQNDPSVKAHGYQPDDLLVDVTALNPSATAATVLLTATATKPGDAVLLVNAVANGYVAYKTKQLRDELNVSRQNLQAQYNQYKAQSDSLYQQILKITNTSDPRIALLTADRNSAITSMNAVQGQLLQLPPPENIHSDVSIIQPAKLTDVTSTSKSTIIILVTGGVGLVVGLLIWLLLVFQDNRVRADDQVTEKLGLSYLGGLTNNKEIQPGSIPTSGLAAQQLADIGMNLRLTGVLPGQWRAPQGSALLITSPQAVEGKTTIATGLAAAAARGGRSVLVVDGNLRNPTTHLAFGTTPAGFGLSGLLKAAGSENIDAAVQRTNIANVWLLPGGTPMEDSTLLLDQRLPNILAQLRKKTDLIIIDGTSLLSGAEAALLASMSDGVALVVDARHDKVALLLRAKAVLRSLTHTPLGVIMNRMPQQKRNPYYAVAYNEDALQETRPSAHSYTSNGNGNGHEVVHGHSEPSPASTGSLTSNPAGIATTPGGRPVSTMPMDFPVMQPQANPPSPFPSPRRMDMIPPQS